MFQINPLISNSWDRDRETGTLYYHEKVRLRSFTMPQYKRRGTIFLFLEMFETWMFLSFPPTVISGCKNKALPKLPHMQIVRYTDLTSANINNHK